MERKEDQSTSSVSQPNNDDTKDNVLRKLSKRLDKNSRVFFFRLGYWIAEHPKLTILLSFVGVAIASLGAMNYKVEDGGEREWVPQNTVSMKNLDQYDVYFPDDALRVTQIILTDESIGNDVGTRQGLLDLVQVLEKVESVTWENYSFKDVCKIRVDEGLALCLTNSVLDLFFTTDPDALVYEADGVTPSFTGTVRSVVEAMDDDLVKQVMFADSSITWSGEEFLPDLYLGDNNDDANNVKNTPALRLNIVLIGSEDQEDNASYEFEANIEDTLINSLQVTGNSKIYVGTIRAREDAGAAQASDIPLLMLGILLAIVYICIALGHLNAVQSRIGLSLLAILSIVLAYASMIGICSLISYYGPVHQLLPLLLVAIGVGKLSI